MEQKEIKLLTLEQVNRKFQIYSKKSKYVSELRKKGLIDGAMYGNRLLFDEESVNRYIRDVMEKQKKGHRELPQETKNQPNSSLQL